MKTRLIFAFTMLLSLCLTGCPAVMYGKIKNDTSKKIVLLHEERLSPSDIGSVNYYEPCIRIMVENHIYEYQPAKKLTQEYVDVGNFSTSTNMIFTKDNKLRIYNKNNPNDFVELKQGCNK